MSDGPKNDDFDLSDEPSVKKGASKHHNPEQADDDMMRSQMRALGAAIGTLEQRLDAIQESVSRMHRATEAFRRIIRRIIRRIKTY